MNNKGFTLVEVLAVVVILSILIAIMVPNVNTIINKQKENSLDNIKKSIESATKIYISDNKYDIEVIGNCNDTSPELSVKKDNEITDNKITVSKLIELGNLKEMKNGIKNPKTNSILNNDSSYATIKYNCQNKDLIIKEIVLDWN